MTRILSRRSPNLSASTLRRWERGYAGGTERPLGSYAGLLATYTGLVAGLVVTDPPRRHPQAALRRSAPGGRRQA